MAVVVVVVVLFYCYCAECMCKGVRKTQKESITPQKINNNENHKRSPLISFHLKFVETAKATATAAVAVTVTAALPVVAMQ